MGPCCGSTPAAKGGVEQGMTFDQQKQQI